MAILGHARKKKEEYPPKRDCGQRDERDGKAAQNTIRQDGGTQSLYRSNPTICAFERVRNGSQNRSSALQNRARKDIGYRHDNKLH
jgi:hypothetical protein